MRMNQISISVIIPVYNEQESIPILYSELRQVLDSLDEGYEIIFIDDGSIDATSKILNNLYDKRENVRLKIITLFRRFGQTQSIQAGIDKAEGRIIVLIDGDLQNDPKDILLILNKLKEGWDLVNGWRINRKDPFFSKRLPSFLANMLIRYLTKVKIHDFGCTLKAFRKEILKHNFLLGNMHRLLPLYIGLKGYKVTEVIVNHRKRIYGETKYGFLRTYELILEMLRIHFFESYLSFPLYYFGLFAFILIIIGAILGIFIITRKLVFGGIWISPLFFISIILVSLGIQIILIGILAEILVRVFLQNNKERLYIIKEFKE